MNERTVFFEALDRNDPEQRRAFLDAAYAGNPDLRAGVEALLRAHEVAGGFLNTPIVPVDLLLARGHPGPSPVTASVAVEPRGPAPGTAPPNVRMAHGAGRTNEFAAETAALLRRRLTVIALVTAVVMALAMIPTLSRPLVSMRWGIILVEVGCWVVLRGPRVLSLRALRAVELVVFGVLAVQMTAMPAAVMLESARAGDVPTVIMDGYFIQGVWVLQILTYGLLIPNTWQRALAVTLPAGCVPYLSPVLLGMYEPKVKEAFDALTHPTPYPVALIAVAEGMIYSHFMQGVRRDLFRARRFAQYRLLERIGAGGMGEVFRAEHELLKRECAIKLIRPGIDADPEMVARFEQEVRATAKLSHGNTVDVYDYGRTDDGTFYYVMELLKGMNLADLVRRAGPLPPGRVVYLLAQACDALREAHGSGLVHRDIKPANVFAATRGGVPDVVKLLDFGLVRRADGADEAADRPGTISGTPGYMAPEQARPGGAADARSDLYAVGAVVYFLLTGRPPFDGKTAYEQIAAAISEPLVPPSQRGVPVPADLEAVILRCLAKHPDDRYPDAAALKRALLGCGCNAGWDADRATEWWAARPEALLPTATGGAGVGETTIMPSLS